MNLFTYGTLMVSAIFFKVTGCRPACRNARLYDYSRYRIKDRTFPAISPEKGKVTGGIVYAGLDEKCMERLDQFEGELYERHAVTVYCSGNYPMEAEVYVIKNGYRHLLTNRPWHLDRFVQEEEDLFEQSYQEFESS